MSKQIPREMLIDLVDRFPEGASLEEILLGLDPSVPRRTLQRWLATLVKHGQLIPVGNAKARRYKVPTQPEQHLKAVRFPIPVSEKGERIYEHVVQPIQARKRVGYRREFLDNYVPNQTHYLPETLRRKLFGMGNEDGKYPAGTFARQIFHRLLIDLSWNSSRLEGNTYSLLETERLLDSGKAAEGKNLIETQMILNHKAAIEFLIDSAEEKGINRFTILNLHTLLSENLLPDPSSCGRLRNIPVGIGKSVFLPCSIPQVIEECFNQLIDKTKVIQDPIEQAFFLMVHLPYLQPFDDVNKRTSRLAANIPLIGNNLCPLSFIDVPDELYITGLLGVYELNQIELLRDVFEWAYERSCAFYSTTRKIVGEPDPFRLQYRNHIYQTVNKIVVHGMNKEKAVDAIRHHAHGSIPAKDQPRFIEIVERELQSLHEGNIARFGLRPSEFEKWQKVWK